MGLTRALAHDLAPHNITVNCVVPGLIETVRSSASAVAHKQSPLGRQIEAFLVVDGANLDHITTRGLGSRRFEVSFTGPGGHSWSDFGTGNPVHALCRAVTLFSETRMDSGPKSAINVGLIDGGSSINAIAQSARAKVDIRSESNPRIEELSCRLPPPPNMPPL